MTQINPANVQSTVTGAVPTQPPSSPDERARALRWLDEATAGLDMFRPGTPTARLPYSLLAKEAERTQALRRGRYLRPADDRVGRVNLVEVDGVFLWQDANEVGVPISPATGPAPLRPGAAAPLRRGWPFSRPRGTVVEQFKFEKLPPNQVGQFLSRLDAKLTPAPGLKAYKNGALQPVAAPQPGRRTLLVVHGTFSHASNLFDQLNGFPGGRDFLAKAGAHYQQILAFDHPTLSVSPLLNALDLQRLFVDFAADKQVDVVCHSRGGLVTRWWVEAFGGARWVRKVVFVASPLAGTSLAAPPRLRDALDLLTNVGKIVGGVASAASTVVPFMTVAAGLIKVFTSVTGAVANTPLLDAAVAMIPGLACQSRVGNNFELIRLRGGGGGGAGAALPEYHAITGSFQPEEVGLKVWRIFANFGQRTAEFGAGTVFKSPNDLVVDSNSMTQLFGDPVLAAEQPDGTESLAGLPGTSATAAGLDDGLMISADGGRVLDFGTTSRVWHTNYFQQPETAQKLSDWLC